MATVTAFSFGKSTASLRQVCTILGKRPGPSAWGGVVLCWTEASSSAMLSSPAWPFVLRCHVLLECVGSGESRSPEPVHFEL